MKKISKYMPVITVVLSFLLVITAIIIKEYISALAWLVTTFCFVLLALQHYNIYGLFAKYIDTSKAKPTLVMVQLNDLIIPDCVDNIYHFFGVTKERFYYLTECVIREFNNKDITEQQAIINLSAQCVHQNELGLIMYYAGYYTTILSVKPISIIDITNIKPNNENT